MHYHLHLHLGDDGSITVISYDLYDDQHEHLRTWVGTPEDANSHPYLALRDLLGRLDRTFGPLTLFP